jgi:glutamate synthase (NADPH/NADH) small chain
VKYITTDTQTPEEGFEDADSVFVAISQKPTDIITSNNTRITVDEEGLYIADDHGRTTREGVFASGDAVTGARTVVEAVAFSKRAADAIEEYIKEKESAVS